MRNPLFFFIGAIVLDLILKSIKDKKKIEEARVKRAQQIPTRTQSPNQTQSSTRTMYPKEKKTTIEPVKAIVKDKRDLWKEEDIFNKKVEVEPVVKEKMESDLKKDILRGIIFSEILSEPKSIKNQRKSM